jgi:hypothetical protein
MVRAIREIVTVGPDGKIELRAPELRQGARAEVIVLVESDQGQQTPVSPLEAFEALQRSLDLTPEAAEEWIRQAADERKASSRR